MNILSKMKRATEVNSLQSAQQLENCALICAYVFGAPGGWFAICHGHVDGFRSDYAYVHWNGGNFENHEVMAFYLLGTEGELSELEEIREACKEAHEADELPPVVKFTPEEITAAAQAVMEAFAEACARDLAEFIVSLCGDGASVLDGCDWSHVALKTRAENE